MRQDMPEAHSNIHPYPPPELLPMAEIPEGRPELPEREKPVETRIYRGETYYDIPPIKHSHYEWKTATAFLFNGIGGGSQILATAIDLLGSEQDRKLVRAGRYLAVAGGSLSTITLISSLHKWQRFYNMLRIFKKTSPMSVGIWAITPFTMLSALAAAGQIAEDFGYEKAGRRIARLFGIPASVLGGYVISYMGTELEETNMPIWACTHPLMAPLYAASGMANSAVALLAASKATGASGETQRGLDKFALLACGAETALSTVVERRWSGQPEAGAFKEYPYALIYHFGFVGLGQIVPLLLRLVGKRADGRSSTTSILTAAAKLGGGWLMQMTVIYAGRESGRRARDYFEFTSPHKLDGGKMARRVTHIGEGGERQVRESAIQKQGNGRFGKSSTSLIFGLGLLSLGAGMYSMSHRKREETR